MTSLARPYATSRSRSFSDDGSHSESPNRPLEAPVLVYHESARSIVFRDHLRRFVGKNGDGGSEHASLHGVDCKQDFVAPLPHKALVVMKDQREVDQVETLGTIANEILDPNETVIPSQAGIPESQIAGFQPRIAPLPDLDFGPDDEFQPLLEASTVPNSDWTAAEKEVVKLFQRQHCAVKTIKNTDWGPFLHRFQFAEKQSPRQLDLHRDIPPDAEHPYNSFLTSCTILPSEGKKMRTYGSTTQYTVGVVFALPEVNNVGETEDQAAERTETWAWPSGYSAKTEFNIDGRGRLINGRKEALISLSTVRQYNDDYLTKDSYMIGLRRVEGGLNQIPYNEVYLRIGGIGRVASKDGDKTAFKRTFDRGLGLPIALFVRTAKFGHLISLLRTKARLAHTWGEQNVKGIPLLLVTPEKGVQVITESIQKDLWKVAAHKLCPFQNNTIAHKTTVSHTDETAFQQKVDELLDLDESIQDILTPEELARIAGGFGATDDSVAEILKKAMVHDRRINKQAIPGNTPGDSESHKLQDIVNEGLASALRSGDYHTSRQLLILYTLVASQGDEEVSDEEKGGNIGEEKRAEPEGAICQDSKQPGFKHPSSLGRDAELMKKDLRAVQDASRGNGTVAASIPSPPPPPPLDTDRLRSATNSDGLLAVLGAAQVLRAMQDGSAKTRVEESVQAVEEWVNYGEQSVAFRIASWYDQRAAQDDLKIAMSENSSFLAFVSNKAISNRKAFAQQLRDAMSATDFTDVRFLHSIAAMVGRMHSPCLRLELLQYVLGLDNRYSVAHVARSVELAMTCLSISAPAPLLRTKSL